MFAVIARIAYGFDAKFCHTVSAEKNLEDRIKARLDAKPMRRFMSMSKKQLSFRNLLPKVIGVSPQSWPSMFVWLTAKGFLT
jgi:hypothetical protein